MELKKELSSELGLEVKLEDENLNVELGYAGKMGGAKMVGYVKVEAVLDEIKKAIPGKYDDMLIDMLNDLRKKK
jgi:hypothetical protein